MAEYSRQSLRWAALALLICGLCLCLDSLLAARGARYARLSHTVRPAVVMGTVLLSVILPVFAFYRIFFSEKALFVSEGIVNKMSSEMPRLLGIEAGSKSLPEISKDIIDQEVIKRDLVITGSMLQTPTVLDR